MKPPVSIVIPTYNRAEWLRGAIDSVLEQDYPNLEVVVVDDGSTDDTASVLADYERRHPSERFRALGQENSGQAKAINRGNELARGEILGYLSDDDALLPGAVSRLAAELSADPAAVIAYPAYREIDTAGTVTDTVLPIEYSPKDALRLHETVIGPGGLVRRGALVSADGWDPGLRWLGDMILWMRVGLQGRAVRIDEPLALWRRHSDSATVHLSVAHAREHLRCVAIASELDGMGPLSLADEAEALRNACIFAAVFTREWPSWPTDRFLVLDLHRRRTSAGHSFLGPDGDIDWSEAEGAAKAYREIVMRIVPDATSGGGGLERARARLAEVGMCPPFDAPAAKPEEVALALIEAAYACGRDIDPATARHAIVDRTVTPVDDADIEELGRLGFLATRNQLEAALKRRLI